MTCAGCASSDRGRRAQPRGREASGVVGGPRCWRMGRRGPVGTPRPGSAVIRDLILRVLDRVVLGVLEGPLWILDGVQWLLDRVDLWLQEPDHPDVRTSDAPWYMQKYWPVYMDVDLRIIHDESRALKPHATALAAKIRAEIGAEARVERGTRGQFDVVMDGETIASRERAFLRRLFGKAEWHFPRAGDWLFVGGSFRERFFDKRWKPVRGRRGRRRHGTAGPPTASPQAATCTGNEAHSRNHSRQVHRTISVGNDVLGD